MKHINIRTGENLGGNALEAIVKVCEGRSCDDCEINNYLNTVYGKDRFDPFYDCGVFSGKHPDLALALIGVAAVPDGEDSEQNADTTENPASEPSGSSERPATDTTEKSDPKPALTVIDLSPKDGKPVTAKLVYSDKAAAKDTSGVSSDVGEAKARLEQFKRDWTELERSGQIPPIFADATQSPPNSTTDAEVGYIHYPASTASYTSRGCPDGAPGADSSPSSDVPMDEFPYRIPDATDTPVFDDSPSDTPPSEPVSFAPKPVPFTAERLGVKVNEWFYIPRGDGTYMRTRIKRHGEFVTDPPMQRGATNVFLEAINHPETVIHSPRAPKPLFKLARILGASYVSRDSRDENSGYDFWTDKPRLSDSEEMYVNSRPLRALPLATLYFNNEGEINDPHWLAPGKCAFVGNVTDGTPNVADPEQK